MRAYEALLRGITELSDKTLRPVRLSSLATFNSSATPERLRTDKCHERPTKFASQEPYTEP